MEENRAIELKNLQIGDEVIISGTDLRYFTILRNPQIRTKKSLYYNTRGAVMYKAIKVEETYRKFLTYSKNISNRTIYYDFNYNNIWLVKRKDDEF